MGRRHDDLIKKAVSVPVLQAGIDRVMVAQKAEGPRVFDIDNVGYIDYIGGGGATILGFANQFVLDAVRKVIAGGVPEGFHVPQEVDHTNRPVLPGYCPAAKWQRPGRQSGQRPSGS